MPFAMAGPFTPAEVDDDAFPEAMRRMMTDYRSRCRESCLKKGIDYDSAVTDLAGEIGQYLYWMATRADADSNRHTPKKDLTEEDKAVLCGERKKDLTQTFMPMGM